MLALNQNSEWLMENGSPAIRMRTMKEIIGGIPSQEMVDALMAYPMTRYWLSLLGFASNLNSFHSSKAGSLENLCGKLRELGFCVSFSQTWKAQLQPFVDFLHNEKDQHGLDDFTHLFIYHPLITLCYTPDVVVEASAAHLTQVASFCEKMNYDIYVDPNSFGMIPKAYKNRKLLNPKTNHCLPTIWDMYALAYTPQKLCTPKIVKSGNKIIKYILSDEYQSYPTGYGIMYHPPTKRYYAHGWDVHLPGWKDQDFQNLKQPALFLQRLELMANFSKAHQLNWFQRGVKHLESFRTDRGTYRFPSTYLKEGTSGYYVTGAYMRLEENRRRKIALEIDSTFRMELIKKRIFSAGID